MRKTQVLACRKLESSLLTNDGTLRNDFKNIEDKKISGSFMGVESI